MFTLRPTMALAARMKIKLTDEPAAATTRLGDWYAVPLTLERRQLILCVSDQSRLPILIPAAPYGGIAERLIQELPTYLRKIGIAETAIQEETSQMREFKIGKTTNRSVVGTMNDYRKMFSIVSRSPRHQFESLLEASLYLAETPSLVIAGIFPLEVTQKLLS